MQIANIKEGLHMLNRKYSSEQKAELVPQLLTLDYPVEFEQFYIQMDSFLTQLGAN